MKCAFMAFLPTAADKTKASYLWRSVPHHITARPDTRCVLGYPAGAATFEPGIAAWQDRTIRKGHDNQRDHAPTHGGSILIEVSASQPLVNLARAIAMLDAIL